MAADACAAPSALTACGMAMPLSARRAAAASNARPRRAAGDRLSCVAHCAAQASAPSDAQPLTSPPVLWTAMPLAAPKILPLRSAIAAAEYRYRLRAPPRPRASLFCSLLI